jgi:hypothetical protein
MTHIVEGLIVPTALAQTISVEHAVLVPLNAPGVAFIPMTDALLDGLATRFPTTTSHALPEFSKLSPSAVLWLEQLSATGRVAYIETEYFGGVGAQAATVWEDGKIILGPKQADIGPINDALRLLGITRTETQDEFEVAGLGRHRQTESPRDLWRLDYMSPATMAGVL